MNCAIMCAHHLLWGTRNFGKVSIQLHSLWLRNKFLLDAERTSWRSGGPVMCKEPSQSMLNGLLIDYQRMFSETENEEGDYWDVLKERSEGWWTHVSRVYSVDPWQNLIDMRVGKGIQVRHEDRSHSRTAQATRSCCNRVDPWFYPELCEKIEMVEFPSLVSFFGREMIHAQMEMLQSWTCNPKLDQINIMLILGLLSPFDWLCFLTRETSPIESIDISFPKFPAHRHKDNGSS